jgi:hypothetical protein
MDTKQQDWIEAFAAELQEFYPQLGAWDTEHIGDALSRDAQWSSLNPVQAAEQWASRMSTTGARRQKDGADQH